MHIDVNIPDFTAGRSTTPTNDYRKVKNILSTMLIIVFMQMQHYTHMDKTIEHNVIP